MGKMVQKELSFVCYPTIWTQGIFRASEYPLESLVNAIHTHDFAVFIFHPDDITKLRSSEFNTVRDNIIFEFGLFVGQIGLKRTFFIVPRHTDFHLPSDLAGLIPLQYDPEHPDLQAALGPACHDISEVIQQLGKYNSRINELETKERNLQNKLSLIKFMDGLVRHSSPSLIDYDAILGTLISNFNSKCDIIKDEIRIVATTIFELSKDSQQLIQIGRSGGGTQRHLMYKLNQTDVTVVEYFHKQADEAILVLDQDKSRELSYLGEYEYTLYVPLNIQRGIIVIVHLRVESIIPEKVYHVLIHDLISANQGIFSVLTQFLERKVSNEKTPVIPS